MEVLKQGALSLWELQDKILRNAKYCVEAMKLLMLPLYRLRLTKECT